jgi:hypothetical protein
MKKTSIVHLMIAVIIAICMTSCHYTPTKLLDADSEKEVVWGKMMPDSIRTKLLHFFDLIGKDEILTSTKVLGLREKYLSGIPDSLVSKIPVYNDEYYGGMRQGIAEGRRKIISILVTSVKTRCIAPPTFYTERMDSVFVRVRSSDLRIGTIRKVESFFSEDGSSVLMGFYIIVLFIMIVCFILESKAAWGFLGLEIAPLIVSWSYSQFFVSILLTSIVLIVLACCYWWEPLWKLLKKMFFWILLKRTKITKKNKH